MMKRSSPRRLGANCGVSDAIVVCLESSWPYLNENAFDLKDIDILISRSDNNESWLEVVCWLFLGDWSGVRGRLPLQ